MSQLVEGLLQHDLDHLILPLLDIDTFESKIDNSRAIVVAFYLFEQDPANDLDLFISKSNVLTLDVETSPAPTTDGYYLVFVEMKRDRDFPEALADLISEINNLTDVKQWNFKTIGTDEIFDLSEESLREHINLDPQLVPLSPKDEVPNEEDNKSIDKKEIKKEKDKEPEEKAISELAMPILINGLMESMHSEGDLLTLISPSDSKRYRVLKVGDVEPSMPVLMPNIGDDMLSESLKLSTLLGGSYQVNVVDNGLLVNSDQGYLILKPL